MVLRIDATIPSAASDAAGRADVDLLHEATEATAPAAARGVPETLEDRLRLGLGTAKSIAVHSPHTGNRQIDNEAAAPSGTAPIATPPCRKPLMDDLVHTQ